MPQISQPQTIQLNLTPDQWTWVMVFSFAALCREEGAKRYSAAEEALFRCEKKPADEMGKALPELMKAVQQHASELLKTLARYIPKPWHQTDGGSQTIADMLGALGIEEDRTDALPGELPWAWDEALASYLEKMGDSGRDTAEGIRAKSAGMKAADNPSMARAQWFVSFGNELRYSIPRHAAFASVVWEDVVKPRLAREAEEARKRQTPIRFPQPAAQALTTGRTATIKSRKKSLTDDERWGDWTSCVTLALPGASAGAQIALPLPSDVKIADGNTLQSVLTGGLLRTYLATWALWADNRSLLVEGGFAWDEETVIRNYLKKVGKVDGKLRAEVRADLARLCQIRVVKAGGWSVQGGSEPLISAYREDSSGRTVYVHSGVISLFLNDNFSQVPRNVLSLRPDDMALALGLATLARSLAAAMIANNNRHEGTLKELASACGADVASGVRKHGPAAYWQKIFEALRDVAEDGGVGKVEMVDAAEVPAEGARVRLTLSDEMVTAYRPLSEAATRRRSAEKALRSGGSRKTRKGSAAT